LFKKFLILIIFFIIGFSCIGSSSAKEKTKANDNSPQPLKGSAVINITSDFMDYYQEKDQIIATGNVRINVEAQSTTLEADKVIYDRENDLLIASRKKR